LNSCFEYIEVLHPGIGCSVQDKGRFGYWSEGIPISGVMDGDLAGMANILVENNSDNAVIEWKLKAPKLKFPSNCTIAVVGFNIRVCINTTRVRTFNKITVQKNDILHIKLDTVSSYGYIAISGGIQTKKVLGSQSYYPNITPHQFLEKGMKLAYLKNYAKVTSNNLSRVKPPLPNKNETQLEVLKGPEFDLLSQKEQNNISLKLFSLNSQSNRMGFLLNETIEKHSMSILSSPILPGTIQWTPSGKLIILMRDAQTVGGYPRIFQLRESSISKLARVVPNGFIQFIFYNK